MGLDDVTRMKYMTGQYVDCALLHPGDTCIPNALVSMIKVFARCTKTYATLYGMQMVLLHYKKIWSDPKHSLFRLLKSICRSCLFISVYSAQGRLILCYFKEILHRYGPTEQLLASFLTSATVYIESPERRLSITKYLLPRALETLWNIWVGNGWVRSIPSADVMLFALAMGILMMMKGNDSEYMDKSYISSLRWIYGDN
mmetsp:Transcript_13029/g.24247  ORF Transcript_13029/g.24247 Transcript_13029/m.24247 type:complete len:200 (+) Transcript_13029:42-641(+)